MEKDMSNGAHRDGLNGAGDGAELEMLPPPADHKKKQWSKGGGYFSRKVEEDGDIEPPERVPIKTRLARVGSTLSKPKKEWFLNIKSYVAVLSVMGVLISTDNMLRLAVLTTLERRFGFKTFHNGMIMSAFDIGHVVILLVLSIVGAKVHKPRVLALGGFMASLSGLLWALPHFIFGSGVKPSTSATGLLNQTEEVLDPSAYLCLPGRNVVHTDPCGRAFNETMEGTGDATDMMVSFWLLFISQCLLGAGLAPMITVGITYLDDNTDPASSALGVSITMSLSSFGLVFGFLVGAFTTSLYVDLSPTELTQSDAAWIGAWWLGSICIGGIIFVASVPFLAFPRHMEEEPSSPGSHTASPRQRRESLYLREEDDHPHTRAERLRPILQRAVSEMSAPKLKEIPKESKGLVTNLIYISQTLAMCAITFLPAGVFTFLPKYLETQFLATTMVGNIITAIVTALAMAAGTLVGGYIAAAYELTSRGSAKLTVIGVGTGVLCFVAALFLGCPQLQVAGNIDASGVLDPALPCNSNCSCGHEFLPVCGDDNFHYYSPCHAGCHNLTSIVDDVAVFSNCSCTQSAGDSMLGSATTGWCETGCKTLVPYAIVIFICVFAVNLGASPILQVLIRNVDDDRKSFALGINNLLTSVLASIPAPMMYGRLIDDTCVLTEPSCDGGGLCLMYDNAGFRYILHGITLGAIFLALIFLIITWLKLRGTDEDQKEKAEQKAPAETRELEPIMDSERQRS